MECNDIVERQNLIVENCPDELDDENIANVPKICQTPSSNKIFSSNSCSVKGDSSTKVSYVNEKKGQSESAQPTSVNKSSTKRIQKDQDPIISSSKEPSSSSSTSNSSFTARPLKHHSFISEVNVRHMEKALLELLEDFHSGKLRAFGSGATMQQMTNIREQQESLAKLHFDLGATNESMQSSENMTKLVQKLELLTTSLEQLTIN